MKTPLFSIGFSPLIIVASISCLGGISSLKCWKCNSIQTRGCGTYTTMAETRVADALTNCSKGICFRVAMTGNSSTSTKNVTSAKMIKSSQRRTTGKPNETIHLFCGFRSQERTLCQEIRAIATLLGDGMKVGHCSSCATDLCNGVSAISTGNAFAGIGLLNLIKML